MSHLPASLLREAAVFASALGLLSVVHPLPGQQPGSAAGAQTAAPAQASPAPAVEAQQAPPERPTVPAAADNSVLEQTSAAAFNAATSSTGEITEEMLQRMLVGKTLYLRGGYLNNSLSFDEHGKLIGDSPRGSYTLCLIKVQKVRLSRHTLELTGERYGLHFLGQLPNEDPTKAVNTVQLTAKHNLLKISIDRELVVIPKPKKGAIGSTVKAALNRPGPGQQDQQTPADGAPPAGKDGASAPASPSPAPTLPSSSPSPSPSPSESAMTQGPPQPAPAADAPQPADAGTEEPAPDGQEGGRVTTTSSPLHAARLLGEALNQIFAQGLDTKLIASLPQFWRLYFEAAAHQTDYRPADPGIYRQSSVDQRARLLSPLEPPSNAFAQANGVAGMALYHVILGADGKPQSIVVARPIGFGLDENAAETIRKASFQPAMKDGRAVPVLIDLVVQFRIFSHRTDQSSQPGAAEASPEVRQVAAPYGAGPH